MQRVVVHPIRLDQLVDAIRVERLHLRHETLATNGRRQLLVGELASGHRADGVRHRRQDDRPGVDQRAVEVEEADGEPRRIHRAIVASVRQ